MIELINKPQADIQNAQKIMNEIRQLGSIWSMISAQVIPLTDVERCSDRYFGIDRFVNWFLRIRNGQKSCHIVSMANALIFVSFRRRETNSQAEFLMSVGCNFAQGYLYGKPMPQKDFEQLLDQTSNLMVNDSDSFAIKASDMIGMTASEQIAI